MQHLLAALVQDQPGVLAHISGMLASRGFNIESLAVARCEQPRMSRMVFVVNGDDNTLDQVRKQLEKIVSVVEVHDISTDNFVERDLMLLKVKATPEKRMEIVLLVEMFRGKVVDVSPGDLIIEIAGHASKIDAFIALAQPYEILELMRTGSIAVVRTRPKPEVPA
jgi:acetolactate synthase-1/3 small subunit